MKSGVDLARSNWTWHVGTMSLVVTMLLAQLTLPARYGLRTSQRPTRQKHCWQLSPLSFKHHRLLWSPTGPVITVLADARPPPPRGQHNWHIGLEPCKCSCEHYLTPAAAAITSCLAAPKSRVLTTGYCPVCLQNRAPHTQLLLSQQCCSLLANTHPLSKTPKDIYLTSALLRNNSAADAPHAPTQS